jgi:alpha-N-acetylglucosamine transferase
MAKPTNFLKCGILLSAIASLLMLLLCFHPDIIPSAKGILNKQLQSPPARLYPVSRPAEDSGGAEDAPRPEAYITFLKDETDTYYKNARLLIWSLMHDPETRDENRPVIVLTTDRVPREWQLQLAADGADVRKVGWLDGHFDGRAATGRYEHLETKLNIFNQTDFQLLFFIDADHVLFKPLEPVWQDATALPGTPAMMAQPDPGYDVLLQVQNSFNSGFMLIRPSRQIFEELLEVTDYVEGWVDQVRDSRYSEMIGECHTSSLFVTLINATGHS